MIDFQQPNSFQNKISPNTRNTDQLHVSPKNPP